MSESACAENADLDKTLGRLARILPYRSRRVTVAFGYASRCFGNRILVLGRRGALEEASLDRVS